MSRSLRVLVILALFGWTLAGVPDRVQAQRSAVAGLAAERGAASAGGALMARIADLRRLDAGGPGVWRVEPGKDCYTAVAYGYTDAIDSVRRRRACEATRLANPALRAAQLVRVDGDAYLVVPGAIGRRTAEGELCVENVEATDLPMLELHALAEADEAHVDEAPAVESEAAQALAEAQATEPGAALLPPEPPPPPLPPAPPPPETPLDPTTATTTTRGITLAGLPIDVKVRVERDGRLVEERHVTGDADVSLDLAGLQRLVTSGDLAELLDMKDLIVRSANGVTPSPEDAARMRAVLTSMGVDATAIDAILRPAHDPELYVATATVAWWPPIEADIEARTGIPLQVGGEPPRARAILPGHRLAGVALWSLPTPETEATIDLFDGGTVLWLLLLTGLLGRELFSWRRAIGFERDRQATRDAILARLSHELRTPAASVRSLVDALDLPGTTEAERQQFRDLARSEAERLAVGLDRLLQAARGEARVRVDPVPLDLAAWADAVRARWLPRLPGLVVEGTRPSPAVADPERLDEAIDALLDNVRKYGGPTVTLTVAPGRFTVEDDGEGIPAKDRARVLQKFERVEGRVNDPGGHGLGLWVVGEVARAHGGGLTVEGRNRFVFTLGSK